jgi:hypothetical protein
VFELNSTIENNIKHKEADENKTGKTGTNEKTVATFETQYRDNPVAKPQEISITITNKRIYGSAFVSQQYATYEDDIIYTKFNENIDEITKIDINKSLKKKPIYITFERDSKDNKYAKDRKRIILPAYNNPDLIVNRINETISRNNAPLSEVITEPSDSVNDVMNDTLNSTTINNSIETEETSQITDNVIYHIDSGEHFEQETPAEETFTEIADILSGLDEYVSGEAAKKISTALSDKISTESISAESISAESISAENISVENISDETEENVLYNNNDNSYDKNLYEATTLESEDTLPPIAPAPPVLTSNRVEDKPKETPAVVSDITEINENLEAEVKNDSNTSKERIEIPVSANTYDSLSLEQFEQLVKKLKIMYDTGVLTSDEYKLEKQKILERLY